MMLNTPMQDQDYQTTLSDNTVSSEFKNSQTPNESAAFHIDGVVKIFDPNTNEVLRELRA